MKQRGFALISLIPVLAVIAFVGLYLFKTQSASVRVEPTPLAPVVSDNFKSYKNAAYGIEFKYDMSSSLTEATSEGRIVIALNDPGLRKKSANTPSGVSDMDMQYLTIETQSAGAKYSDCQRWYPSGVSMTQKNFGQIQYNYAEFNGANNTYYRLACIVHDNYAWIFSNPTYYKEHAEKTGTLFDRVLSSFKFD